MVIPSGKTVALYLILTTASEALAAILTVFRLYFRYSIGRLWWDDFWAALTLLCNSISIIGSWLLATPLDNPYLAIFGLDTAPQSRNTHIVSFWLAILFYTCTIWFARFSIISSLIRIVPPTRSVRLATLGSAFVLALMGIFVLLAKALACSIGASWYNQPPFQCPIPEWVAISEAITDSLSGMMLVYLPLRLLWRMRLPSNQRIMIMAVFSASFLTTVVSIVHTAYIIPPSFTGEMIAQIEGIFSLIVCNLLFLATYVYRITRGRDLDACIKVTGAANPLTTIELYISEPSNSWHTSVNAEAGKDDSVGFTSTCIASSAGTGARSSCSGDHSGPNSLTPDAKEAHSAELSTNDCPPSTPEPGRTDSLPVPRI